MLFHLRILNIIPYGLRRKSVLLLLDNIFSWFASKLYKQMMGIPMSTNCVSFLHICFCFVVKETVCCPVLMKIKLMFLKHSKHFQIC